MSYSTHAATTNASKHRQDKYMKLHDGKHFIAVGELLRTVCLVSLVHLFRPGGLREALTINLGFLLLLRDFRRLKAGSVVSRKGFPERVPDTTQQELSIIPRRVPGKGSRST